jgi:hypothetical protein
MHRVLIASVLALSAAGCTAQDFVPTFTYRPTPAERIHIVDSPADVRHCYRLREVSPTVATVPGFASDTEAMLQATVALGGTHLYLERRSQDWSLVRGIAYDCEARHRRDVVIRAKG